MNSQLLKKLLFGLPLLLVLLSGLVSIYATGRVSDMGEQLHALEQKRVDLKNNNEHMLVELSAKRSLLSLREQAVSEGFVNRTSLVRINNAGVLAKQ